MSSHTVGEHSIHLSYQEVMESHIDNLLMFLMFSLLSCRGIVKSLLHHTQLCVSIHSDKIG